MSPTPVVKSVRPPNSCGPRLSLRKLLSARLLRSLPATHPCRLLWPSPHSWSACLRLDPHHCARILRLQPLRISGARRSRAQRVPPCPSLGSLPNPSLSCPPRSAPAVVLHGVCRMQRVWEHPERIKAGREAACGRRRSGGGTRGRGAGRQRRH